MWQKSQERAQNGSGYLHKMHILGMHTYIHKTSFIQEETSFRKLLENSVLAVFSNAFGTILRPFFNVFCTNTRCRQTFEKEKLLFEINVLMFPPV